MSDEAVSDRVFFTVLGIFAIAMLAMWWLLALILTP
jgi:hypothetical protein